jgi:hypothetical protein
MLFCSNSKIKKKVSFSNIVFVCLIPDRKQMSEHGVIDLLWWYIKDYIDFRKNVIKNEII